MPEKIINCAIYTRKSTEEGLEQDFNSLDNQYEFCTNYLKSLNDPALQLLPARYDDGGYSGGSLNRPALQRLLADIQCGLVNRVIIYKIDRLTREIRDFFKLLDVFEKYNVEFVSVKENQYYNNFDCSNNDLKSLQNAPQEVGFDFDCSYNELTSLEGAPVKVGEDMDCRNNSLISLNGAPQKISGDFKCKGNPALKSLTGIGLVKGKIISDIK